MNEFISNSYFFGFLISIVGYRIGLFLKKKINKAYINPLLISVIFVILVLLVFNIDYESYNYGAKYLGYLLTPATVCLAIPLYQQLESLKKNVWAIMSGIIAGVVASLSSVLAFSILFNFTHTQYVTLLPKSITSAFGMGLSQELGGIPAITVAVIIITGVVGNILADVVLKLFRINNKIAKGIAIGSSSHAIGTTKAMEIGEIEGAMSSLSIAVSGIITVIGASIFAQIY